MSDDVRAALARIIEYAPEWADGDIPDHTDCSECARRRELHWPPSEMCEALYSAVSRRDEENRRREASQHYRMRDIAREALARLPADAVPVGAERLGLSPEQTTILRGHLESRQQTLSEFLGDVLMDYGLGRATGKEYPTPSAVRVALAPSEPLDLDGLPFCPGGSAQRYHAIGQCDCTLHDWIEGERITPSHSYWFCSKCGEPGPHDALDAKRLAAPTAGEER